MARVSWQVIDDKTHKKQIEASVVVSQNILEPNLKRNASKNSRRKNKSIWQLTRAWTLYRLQIWVMHYLLLTLSLKFIDSYYLTSCFWNSVEQKNHT